MVWPVVTHWPTARKKGPVRETFVVSMHMTRFCLNHHMSAMLASTIILHAVLGLFACHVVVLAFDPFSSVRKSQEKFPQMVT